MCFYPFEDEVRFVNRGTGVWDQHGEFFEGIVVFGFGSTVPGNFSLEGEWDTLFCQRDADFAGVWGT